MKKLQSNIASRYFSFGWGGQWRGILKTVCTSEKKFTAYAPAYDTVLSSLQFGHYKTASIGNNSPLFRQLAIFLLNKPITKTSRK